MAEKELFSRMADVEDSSSFGDEIKQLNEPENRSRKTSGVPVLESTLEAGAPLQVQVNFCTNNAGDTSGSSSMVDVMLDNTSTLCSSSLPGPLLDPSFPGPSAMTDVSSSMREKTVIFPINSENGRNEAPFLCSSSDLKQEPIEIDDGHNSCSSSAGAQPTSTMDNSDTIGPEDGNTLNNHPGTGDEEDMEVGNHFAAHLRNSKGTSTSNGPEKSCGRNNSSEEEDGSNQARAAERKPEINNLNQRALKNDKKRKPCHRPHCCDAGESKVSTSVRNLIENASNSARETSRRELPDSKPPLSCVHRKRSTSSTISNEQSSIARDAIESPTECQHCGIVFPDRTLYYLHKGMHSDSNPWRCNMCGEMCDGKYDFYAHVISREHR